MMSMRDRSRQPTTSLRLARELLHVLDDVCAAGRRSKWCSVSFALYLARSRRTRALVDDADRRQRLLFEQADRQLRALDELLDQRLRRASATTVSQRVVGRRRCVLQMNTSMLLPLSTAFTTQGASIARAAASLVA